MLVKINKRGSGGGRGPTEYLTSDKDHRGQTRSVAPAVLRGDLQQTRELIDSLDFAQRYTSGSLNFSEPDITAEQKNAVMNSFERCLFPEMSQNQYSVLWVEHRDKNRLELNFVIPNIELTTGKRLQPYYDKADRPRVDAWQTLVNDQHGFSDPHDPELARVTTTPQNLPKSRVDAIKAITDGLLTLETQSRAEIISALSTAGFEISRQTKKSISIADPEGGRPLRLSGGIYDQSYRGGEQLRSERVRAAREYRENRTARVREATERYSRGIETRRNYLQKRYSTRAVEDRSMETIAIDSISRRDARSNDHDRIGNSMATSRGQLHDSRYTEKSGGSVDVLPRDGKKLVSSGSGELEHDRVRDSAIERVRAAEQRADSITRACRATANTDQHTNVLKRAIERITERCNKLAQSCREIASRVHSALELRRHEYNRELEHQRERDHGLSR